MIGPRKHSVTKLALIGILIGSLVSTGLATAVTASPTTLPGQAQESQTAVEIDSCTTIDEPGRYVLTADIDDADADVCIDIQSSDVYFDGNGYTVDGVQTDEALNESANEPRFPARNNISIGVGIDTPESFSNVTVADVTVTDSTFGVVGANLTDFRVEGVTAVDGGIGIALLDSNHSVVADSNSSNNFNTGIHVGPLSRQQVSHIMVSDSVVHNNGPEGITVLDASHSLVTNTTVTDHQGFGIRILSTTGDLGVNNTVSDATANRNAFGIALFNTSDSVVTDSTATSNNFVGIVVDASGGSVGVNNTVADSITTENTFGISVLNSLDSTISGNVAQNNTFSGIGSFDSSDVTIADNTIRENGYVGIDLFNVKNVVVSENEVIDTQGESFDERPPFDPAGILLENTSNIILVDNAATGTNGSGISALGNVNTTLILTNDVSENSDDGISINSSETVAVVSSTITDSGDDGIEITDSNWVFLLNNTLLRNGGQAIGVTGSENVLRLDSVEELRELLEKLLQ